MRTFLLSVNWSEMERDLMVVVLMLVVWFLILLGATVFEATK